MILSPSLTATKSNLSTRVLPKITEAFLRSKTLIVCPVYEFNSIFDLLCSRVGRSVWRSDCWISTRLLRCRHLVRLRNLRQCINFFQRGKLRLQSWLNDSNCGRVVVRRWQVVWGLAGTTSRIRWSRLYYYWIDYDWYYWII